MKIRISLVDSEPEIWRLLEINPSLTLDTVHDVIQTAVGWRGSHLHAFSDANPNTQLLNGKTSRRWLPQSLLEDSVEDLPETEWTLGGVLTAKTGPLFYVYDFGDGWTHSLEFAGSIPAPDGAPRARLVAGARRGPLEDSGGIHGYQGLLKALADPSHTDHREAKDWTAWTTGPWTEFNPDALKIDVVNDALQHLLTENPCTGAKAPAIQDMFQRMPLGIRREFLSHLAAAQVESPALVEADDAEAMVAPYLWLVRRIGTGGLSLTQAGWLPPAVVQGAMSELGWDASWIGKANREDLTTPILRLRENARQLGLIRKLKGKLVLSAAVKPLLDRPVDLWLFIARSLAVRHRHDSEQDAALLLLLEIAAGRRTVWKDCVKSVAYGLEALGWTTRSGDGLPLDSVEDLLRAPRGVLADLGIFHYRGGREVIPVTVRTQAQAFARAALQT